MPWLEPDVNDHLEKLAGDGVRSVVLVPIGFVSDHMEVVFDLDTEALATAERLGLDAVRVPTSGTDARFVAWCASCSSSGPRSSAASRSTGSPSAATRRAGTSAPKAAAPTPAARGPHSAESHEHPA